jgi:hypothetical protein
LWIEEFDESGRVVRAHGCLGFYLCVNIWVNITATLTLSFYFVFLFNQENKHGCNYSH